MSLLDTVVLPKLNGSYEVVVKSYQEITNKDGGYIKVIFQFPDREYKFCLFPKRVDYFCSCLKKQFGVEDKTTLRELLDTAKETPISVFIEWSDEYNSYNLAFHEMQ